MYINKKVRLKSWFLSLPPDAQMDLWYDSDAGNFDSGKFTYVENIEPSAKASWELVEDPTPGSGTVAEWREVMSEVAPRDGLYLDSYADVMAPYRNLLNNVLERGGKSSDRTGTGTLSLFGQRLCFDLSRGFPAVTTKRLAFKTMVRELLWFLAGATNNKTLQAQGVKIWDAWAAEDGELGPIYGQQFRSLRGKEGPIDQIANVIKSLKEDPFSRRHIIATWNVADIDDMALPPCHGCTIQFYVRNGKLSCHMYQRSGDLFLGVPFNISSYALLTHMIARVCKLLVGELIITIGDAHIYSNHIEQVQLQLSRRPRCTPILSLRPGIEDIDEFKFEDIKLVGYKPHPSIKAPVAV